MMATLPHTSQRLMEKFVQSVQQSESLPIERPYALFLEESVDQRPPSPALKRYRPEAVDNSVTEWVESGCYRERHYRSDSLLDHSDDGLISRRLTQSAPNMEYTGDAGGFIVPPTPACTGSPSRQAGTEDDYS